VDAREMTKLKRKKAIQRFTLPAVNIKAKEILVLKVTDKKAYDGKVMSKMVEYIFKRSNNNIKIKCA
jgi:hypothetical protein